MRAFYQVLDTVDVSADKTKMERLIRRSKHYVLADGKLMRKNAKEELLQKCISQDGVALLQEIHVGSYGNHATSRSLVSKAFQAVSIGHQQSQTSKHFSDGVRDANFFAK